MLRHIIFLLKHFFELVEFKFDEFHHMGLNSLALYQFLSVRICARNAFKFKRREISTEVIPCCLIVEVFFKKDHTLNKFNINDFLLLFRVSFVLDQIAY